MKRMNSIYKSLLVLSLALLPSAALAVEPVIDGTKTITDVTISSLTAWTNLLSRQVVIPTGSIFHCAVTCSSQVNVPPTSNANDYLYTAFNSAAPSIADGCVRSFSTPRYDGVLGHFASRMAISNTCYIPNLSGIQNFRCLGMKAASDDVSLIIDDSSMQIVCVDQEG